jgi:N-acetylneuraminic acid mutarotase
MKTIFTLIVCFLSLSLSAQVGTNAQWTWLKGDSSAYQLSVYGTKGVASSTSRPGSRWASATWNDASGNFWLFGGEGYGTLNDLWKYNPSTNLWTWVNGDTTFTEKSIYGNLGISNALNKPGARRYSSSWTDLSGNLWLFGGSLGFSGYLNDLWKYDPVINQWTWVKGDSTIDQVGVYGTQGTATLTNKPGGRAGSVTWTDAAGKFWLFGGNLTSNYFNDLWQYDPSTNQWTWMKGDNITSQYGIFGTQGVSAATNKPSSRSNSVSWIDVSGNLWLFGGFGYSSNSIYENLSDLWKYNPATNQWTWMKGSNTGNQYGVYGSLGVASLSNVPGARRTSLGWSDATGNLWLFGGLGFAASGSLSYLNDLWKYDASSNQWVWVKGDNITNTPGIYGTQGVLNIANQPGARGSTIGWKDPSGYFWLFGGGGYGNSGARSVFLNDLWKYDNTSNSWAWKKGDNIYNTFQNNRGIYGSLGVPSAGNTPGARIGSLSWTHLTSGTLWLFGGAGYGKSSFGSLNDLWKYEPNSNQWTWIKGDSSLSQFGVYGTKGISSITNKPGARSNSVNWTDASGNFWLFGGSGYDASGSSGYLNDLWKYNVISNEWTWVSGDNVISQFGVYGVKGVQASSNKPGARGYSVSSIDGSGNLWLFGGTGYVGSGSSGNLNDLWKYDPIANQWTWVSGDNILNQKGIYGSLGITAGTNKPGSRERSVTWTDGNSIWLFGGRGYAASSIFSSYMNDLWKYSIATNQWTWIKGDSTNTGTNVYGISGVAANSNKPGVRQQSIAWKDNTGIFWLFGGNADNNDYTTYSDLWKYDPITNVWTWVKSDSVVNQSSTYGTIGIPSIFNKPGSRYTGISWTDPSNNLWLFGGTENTKLDIVFNDLWTISADGLNSCGSSSWIGVVNDQWEVPGNWDCGKVPTRYTDVIINNPTPYSPIVRSQAECRSIHINPSAHVGVNTGFKLTVFGP